MSIEILKQAKVAAMNAFGDVKGVCGFGIGKDQVNVYVSTLETANKLPATIKGVRLNAVVTRKFVAV